MCEKSTGHVIGLDLSSSFLFGSINSTSPIFTLVHLQLLNLADNNFNSSHIPLEIGSLSRLKYLNLSNSAFLGPIPREISQLSKLVSLDLSQNVGPSSELPDTMADLSSLKILKLSGCNLSGLIPASIGNLSQLTYLDLSHNDFTGQVPSLANLSKLGYLYLGHNNLRNIDNLIWLTNLTKLTDLSLFGIDLSGSILSANLNGLYSYDSLPKFKNLILANCSLKAFPDFLRYQDELESLLLGYNMIGGKIPTWMVNISKESMLFLSLNNNFLTGFEQHQDILPWSNLLLLSIDENKMQGPLPVPPPSLVTYIASHNKFTGKIPIAFCSLSFLHVLNVESNNLTGTIPPCLSNCSAVLTILNLGYNNLQGPVLLNIPEGNKLKILDLNNNQLQGKVPRSLEKCEILRKLDLSHNLIEDEFPFWLGSLEKLQLLLLGSNKLYGPIPDPTSEIDFPKLRICDLSHNNLTGLLPGKSFQTWTAMYSSETNQDDLVETLQVQVDEHLIWLGSTYYIMTITNKGVNTHYAQVSSIFTAIDLSSNNFEGEIPESIGILEGLELLNISNNGLTGEIPSSLGKLYNLESLDISQNRLSGEIPQQLAELNFLEVLNASYNNLTGPIPKGKQFNTFQSDSYEGNSGLCGYPLSGKCGGRTTPSTPTLESGGADDGYVFQSGIVWIVIGLGYVSGVIAGVIIGRILMSKFEYWFIETIERRKHKEEREQSRGTRN